jgi:mannosyltransferase OCH1-like enzyme
MIGSDDDLTTTTTTLVIEIPKIIHVIGTQWLQEMNSWSEYNPEYIIEFYNDDRCNEFIQTYYPQFVFTYNHLQSVRKFDFIRYLIIYHYGGIYADSDITCMQSISNWGLLNTTTFFSGMVR